MDLVNKSGKFEKKFEGFTGNWLFLNSFSHWFKESRYNSHLFLLSGTGGPLGKKLNNSKTRVELGWEPKYPSFAQFLGVSD